MIRRILVLGLLLIHYITAQANNNCYGYKYEYSNGKTICGIYCGGNDNFEMSCDSDLMKELFK